MSVFGSQKVVQNLVGKWGNTVLFLVRVILDTKIEIRGRENLDENGHAPFIVAKHQSELDIAMICALWPTMSIVAMSELNKLPFFGRILRTMDIITVDVDGRGENKTKQIIAGARRMKELGRPFIIFPEGTLMNLGARERYRKGAAHIYAALDVPVTPLACSLGVAWPRREWHKFAHNTIAIELLPPIPPGLNQAEFMKQVEEVIESEYNAFN